MFVSKSKYQRLEADFREVVAMNKKREEFLQDSLSAVGRQLHTLKQYLYERDGQKHVSRLAILNIAEFGYHKPRSRKPVAEQLRLFEVVDGEEE